MSIEIPPCPLCWCGVAQRALQVCEGCEAQILDYIPRTPTLHAEDELDAEDLLVPILLRYPAWNERNERFGFVEAQAWQVRLQDSGHLFRERRTG
jgi:hypothetical protein